MHYNGQNEDDDCMIDYNVILLTHALVIRALTLVDGCSFLGHYLCGVMLLRPRYLQTPSGAILPHQRETFRFQACAYEWIQVVVTEVSHLKPSRRHIEGE